MAWVRDHTFWKKKRFRRQRKPIPKSCHVEEMLDQRQSGRTPIGLRTVQFVLPYMTRFPLQYDLHVKLFKERRHISCLLSPGDLPFRLNTFDTNALLTQDCLAHDAAAKLSTLTHEWARMRWIATQEIDNKKRVGYYYDTIFYSITEVS